MPDFSFAVSMLKKVFDDIYEQLADAGKRKISHLRADSKVQQLHKRLWQIQRVKTIWNPDRPLSLSSIYYPASVEHDVDGVKVLRQVQSISDLHYQFCIVLGTAGQGKSILMKHLVGREIKTGARVPVLYELRAYEGGDLEEILARNSVLYLLSPMIARFSHFFPITVNYPCS